MPIMKELIKEYSKEIMILKITPVGTPIDEKYWVDYFDLIYNQSKKSFDLGKLEIFGKTLKPKSL